MTDISANPRYERRVSIQRLRAPNDRLYSVTLESRWLDAKDPQWFVTAEVFVDRVGLQSLRNEIDGALAR